MIEIQIMNLRGLQYFLAVAKEKHFGRAAEKCFVSQPSLSTQIKNLELELNVQLLERSNKKVMLTDIGEEIAASTQRIFSEIDNIKELAENSNDEFSGKFKLGAFPTLAAYILPAIVTSIQNELPKLNLVLLEEKTELLMQKLRSGKIDAALLALPVNDTQLKQEILFNDEFYLAVPEKHDLSQRKSVAIEELDDEKLMLLEDGHCFRDQALALCHREGIGVEDEFRATSLETLRLMVKAGTGITIIPKIAQHNDEKGIAYIPFKKICPYRTIALVWRKSSSKNNVAHHISMITKNLMD
jgi:LysR family hydrogen peroxide-inducible transcriptional activator